MIPGILDLRRIQTVHATWSLCGVITLAVLCSAAHHCDAADPAPPKDAPELAFQIVVDTTDAPQVAEWADRAKTLCETWYPKLTKEYMTDGAKPAETVTLRFKTKYDGIAATSGAVITISAKWVTDHPEDVGMVIHELMHAVQAYPPSRAGWAVEGIADYVRYWQFEPEKKPKLRFNDRSSYKQGYGVAAAFLAWIDREKSPGVILRLHTVLRAGGYRDTFWQDTVGAPVDDLWKEFVAAQTAPMPKPDAPAKP